MNRKGRLDAAKDWLLKYNGKKIISGYAKWFGVDKICAITELKTLGVIIPESMENQIVESHKRKAEQRKAAKAAKESLVSFDMPLYDSDENFAFIAGYTSGGAPYGLTHEEYENIFYLHDEIALCSNLFRYYHCRSREIFS